MTFPYDALLAYGLNGYNALLAISWAGARLVDVLPHRALCLTIPEDAVRHARDGIVRLLRTPGPFDLLAWDEGGCLQFTVGGNPQATEELVLTLDGALGTSLQQQLALHHEFSLQWQGNTLQRRPMPTMIGYSPSPVLYHDTKIGTWSISWRGDYICREEAEGPPSWQAYPE